MTPYAQHQPKGQKAQSSGLTHPAFLSRILQKMCVIYIVKTIETRPRPEKIIFGLSCHVTGQCIGWIHGQYFCSWIPEESERKVSLSSL